MINVDDVAPLSFSELTRRLSKMPSYDRTDRFTSQRAKFGLALAALAASFSILVSQVTLPTTLQIALLSLLLVLELVGIGTNMWYTRHDFYSLRKPLKDFAAQLDYDLPHHFDILDWLTSQPLTDLERHALFSRFRRERFTQKLPLLAGSIPTLGLIPVALAIYLQARELAAGRQLSLIDALAGTLIVIMYVLSWMSILMKSRIESMDMYLQDALSTVRGGTDD